MILMSTWPLSLQDRVQSSHLSAATGLAQGEKWVTERVHESSNLVLHFLKPQSLLP